jgi:hypothetical protein
MNFRKVNNLTGWAVFLIAMATYMLTREARGSFWDCGEFVASAAKVQLPHPPGAPMFVLLGRFFIILFGDNALTAANAVNLMSAIASAATILFLFWTITHFARKMFVSTGDNLTGSQMFTTMAAGVVGGLAYTFSDSFWFSAVEGEVYALSSFFTALVFWAMLKWEHADEQAGDDAGARARSDRWIIFLFFMMGLSIGVHLLNLLSIPAVVMIYYFRRHYKSAPFKIDSESFTKDKVLLWTAIVTIGLIALLVIANLANEESDLMGVAMVFGIIGFIVALVRIYMKYKAIGNVVSAFFIGCIITGIVQVGVIQYSMKGAGLFDVFFVNSFGMPFFSGFTIYFIALAAVIIWALRFNEKNVTRQKMMIWFIIFILLSAVPFFMSAGSGGAKFAKFLLIAAAASLSGYFFKATALRLLKLSLWCYVFIMIGYFMYFTALIRSNANPAIDMNNVDNPISLVYYLSREQYGEAPLVYGPHFVANYKQDASSPNGIAMKKGEMKYVRGKDKNGKNKYIPMGTADKPTYESGDMQLFPRIWDSSNDQDHANFYGRWLSLAQDQQTGKWAPPTYRDNFEWFFTYQMNLMYWRYFMWNFAGKQNDIQGLGNPRDGNWISGYSFIDNARLGDQAQIPDSIKHNKANNKLFMLPFILGIVGFIYQFFRNRRDWIVSFLLFFFTGIAVVLYLNQPGNQPRERDYAYVGSFYVFAIWIGLAVVAFVRMAREQADKLGFKQVLLYGSVLTFVISIMSTLRGSFGGMILTAAFITALYAAITAVVTLIIRGVSGGGKNAALANISATLLCLITPVIMAQQEWDDHNRSSKTLAPDLAKDYLESCAKNAIIFTFGDNDTYPLWYAQEVEGVRPDIRIINNSLLGIDWYINQLRYKVNEADSVNVIWTPEQIEGHNREYLRYQADARAGDRFYPLEYIMKDVLGQPVIDPETGRDVGPDFYPVKKFSLPVDTVLVRKNGTVNPNDVVYPELQFEIPTRGNNTPLVKNDLIVLNIIAANKWQRPIYFTSPFGELGFAQFLRKDGLAYRLVPVQNSFPQQNWEIERALTEAENKYRTRLGGTQIRDNNTDTMFANLMGKFAFGNAGKKGVYFDEENRRHLLNIRSVYAEAAGNMADMGRKEDAQKLLDKVEAGIDPENLPYAMVSRFNSHNQTGIVYLEAAYKAGKMDLAEKIRLVVRKDLEQQKKYYDYMQRDQPNLYTSLAGTEVFLNDVMLDVLIAVEKKYAPARANGATGEGSGTIQNSASGSDTIKKPDSIPK